MSHGRAFPLPAEHRVALRGFSAFETSALKSFFRLAVGRTPQYRAVQSLADAEFAVVDAEDAAEVAAVLAANRLGSTVFIGRGAPAAAPMRLPRPVDPVLIQRELDACLARRGEPAVALALLDLPAAHPRAPVLADELPVGAPARVLIVDDSEVSLRFLARLAEGLGLAPTLVNSSGPALDALAAAPFPVVLLDADLGDDSELDGLGLCQRIKRRAQAFAERAPAVIVVSGSARPSDRVRGQLAGCDAWLAKPVDEDDLRRALADAQVAGFGSGSVRRPRFQRRE